MSSVSHATAGVVSNILDRSFPIPSTLVPPTAGIDISDTSIKWLALKDTNEGQFTISTYGSQSIPNGIVVNGVIQNPAALATYLKEIKSRLGQGAAAHAALPEEPAYVFSMHVPDVEDREQTLRMIEFEFEGRVPITPDVAVYDFDVITQHTGGGEVGVVVFPKELAESYASVFDMAGIPLLSLEIEARSIARAVTSQKDDPITLMVDFGRTRSGFAVLKHGIPIFTSTAETAGEILTQAVMEKLGVSAAEADSFKNEQGLLAKGSEYSAVVEALQSTANVVADEVARHHHFWNTRRDERGERMSPVGKIILVGGSSNLKGIVDLVAGRSQAPTERGNVWLHVCDFDDYIPPIDRRSSLEYATAVGLALRSHLVW